SDVYSLGCVAFELLGGEPPFTGGSVPALLARHISEPPPSIRLRCPDLPPEVDAALSRALAKHRSQRFDDPRDFIVAMTASISVDAGAFPSPATQGTGVPPVPGDRVEGTPAGEVQSDNGWPETRRRPSTLLHRVTGFVHELRRRKVLGVLAVYVVAAAGVIQLADVVTPSMDLPQNTVSVVILLALAGLPVAAVLAWLYDLVPDAGGPRRRAAGSRTSREVPEREPAPATGTPPEPAAHHAVLPTATTAFIGREEELRELHELLADPSARLVTVTGPGGVGKTRLALQAAERMAGTFPDGVAYGALSGLSAPDLLLSSIADLLGIPLSREDPLSELKSYLHAKQMLLVLDNFEHLTSAAAHLTTLLDDAPGLRMLVTSRERLNLRHESLIALEGLPLCDADVGCDAVELFVAGARRLDRHFELTADNREDITRICALLDGIPLAIELASAWVRALSCTEILGELQRDLDVLSSESPDVEKRHHSMRATFDASWRLLSAEEQSALARLAVFRSAFDRIAAGEVAEAGVPVLRHLVDKSLLTRAGERLLMLDVIRTYALDRLRSDPSSERRARERHLTCFASLLNSLQGDVQRGDAEAIRCIADSIDDVRTAWTYAIQTNNAGALVRGMDGLFHFYDVRGWAREGAAVFARASAAFPDTASASGASRLTRLAAVRLNTRRAVFLQRLGDLQTAEPLLRRSVAAARELDDDPEVVFALHRLGTVHHGMGDFAAAEELHQEAWALAHRIDDRLAEAWSMTYVGNVAWSRGEFEAATGLYTDALELLRAEGDRNGMWVTLNNLGVIAASRQQYEEAQRRFRESLELQSELQNPRVNAQGLNNLGNAAMRLGQLESARQALEESLAISERMGYRSMAGFTLVALAELAIRQNDEKAADTALKHALRTAREVCNHPLALEALLTLARLRLRQGDTHGAEELAEVVARHTGSDQDTLRETAELYAEIGSDLPHQDGAVDLDALLDAMTKTGRGTAGAGVDARVQYPVHAQRAEDS
ncbi:MAG TPA: tetratricopeptide repeat protein, partial [Longimicrobiales bacterium]|nr:tetratricopeptide repeat protein [Longimicrobiales bacterium]